MSQAVDRRPAGKAKSALPEVDRVRQLENTLFAQRWDIEGLTEQRDAALRRIEDAERDLAEAQEELDKFRLLAEQRARELRQVQASADARIEAAVGNQQLAADIAADLLLTDPIEPGAEPLLLAGSFLFDLPFYNRQLPRPLGLAEALRHYVREGEEAGLLANPLFDAGFYMHVAAGVQGRDRFRTWLGHYAAVGALAGIRPGPLVDVGWLRHQARPRAQDRFEPVSWWLRVGRGLNVPPHPVLDLDHYRRHRPGLRPQDDAMADYCLQGARAGASMSPLFDTEFYLKAYIDVRESGSNPLLHYLAYGEREGRQPNPLFDPSWYRDTRAESLPADYSLLGHYVRQGGRLATTTHRLFDGAWYFQRNPDVRDSGEDPLRHYLGPGGRGAARIRCSMPAISWRRSRPPSRTTRIPSPRSC